MLIFFTGHSDDLLHVGTQRDSEEFNVYENYFIAASINILSTEGRAKVYAIYDGCWSFSLGQSDEGDDLDFILQHNHYPEHKYCTGLVLEVPEDTKLAVHDKCGELLSLWSKEKGWQKVT